MNNYLIIAIIILLLIVLLLLNRLDTVRQQLKEKISALEKQKNKDDVQIQQLSTSVEELNETAYTDATTQIGNLDYFMQEAPKMLENPENLVLLGFGISNIVTINRLYGSLEGDKVLCFAADILKDVVGQAGLYAHVQSNLFVVLMRESEEMRAMDFVGGITEGMHLYSDIFMAETKFGIYRVPAYAVDITNMLNCVALAQRTKPENPNDNYVEFTMDMARQFDENKKMCAEMEEALKERKFVMYLQPMVSLHSFQIISAEALVRWEHPTKGLLSPYAFLPVFEKTNLMLKLDEYMWEEGCKTIRRWIDNKIETMLVIINISPIHLTSVDFAKTLEKLLNKYKLKKEMMVLELPESALSTGGIQVKETVNKIADMGFVLCIDNFGSMNSPLNLLRELPITMVKLDRKFIAANAGNEDGQTILRYLIAMAKELDLTVVCEGVETNEQMNFLTEIGCDVAQGYLFSKPVDLRHFDQLNKNIIQTGFNTGEYYPTFSDMENGVNIMEKMLKK